MMTIFGIVLGVALMDLAITWRRNRSIKLTLADILDEIDEMHGEASEEAARVRQLDYLAGVYPVADPGSFDLHVEQALAQADPTVDLRRVK